eukprot:TRINITY_DN104007_c0_g1_i1.p1 TRINITY_DN104007_c0_g1~~TRINITY_DN104007_c0_g1_i1.p1  ORF type:complete len:278 (-),score=42.04 TRINITY_DN104007_c0_g1_i1:205-984(-)
MALRSGGNAATGGYVGSVLRDMYGASLPRAAQELLKSHTGSKRSTSAPPTQSWSCSQSLSDKTLCRKRVDLKVPRVGRGTASGGYSGDLLDVAPPRPPMMPKRKPLSQIVKDTSNYACQLEPAGPLGRDMEREKRRLQDRHGYGLGAHIPGVQAPSAPKRVSFSSSPRRASSQPPKRSEIQQCLAQDIVQSVKERQKELEGADDALSKLVQKLEAPQVGNMRHLIQREMSNISKQRAEIQAAIKGDIGDLQKLVDADPG